MYLKFTAERIEVLIVPPNTSSTIALFGNSIPWIQIKINKLRYGVLKNNRIFHAQHQIVKKLKDNKENVLTNKKHMI